MHIDWSKFQYLARDLIVLATAIYSANLSFLSCVVRTPLIESKERGGSITVLPRLFEWTNV